MQRNKSGFFEFATAGRWFMQLAAAFAVLAVSFNLHAAVTLTTLHTFTGPDGDYPAMVTSLVQDFDGTLYGTTSDGGTYNQGTVYKILSDGSFSNLVSFDTTNGFNPYNGVQIGSDGILYGTTGGMITGDPGTIFKIDSNGILTTLFAFNVTNGANPNGALLQAADAGFYGAANRGGGSHDEPFTGYGSVFRFTTNGELTTLISFY
jgi:uncharacterized repeat protein (TIGR03803 family)